MYSFFVGDNNIVQRKKLPTKMKALSHRKFLSKKNFSLKVVRKVPSSSSTQPTKRNTGMKLSLSEQEASVVANATPANISNLLDNEDLW